MPGNDQTQAVALSLGELLYIIHPQAVTNPGIEIDPLIAPLRPLRT